jgi:hypothetical protein
MNLISKRKAPESGAFSLCKDVRAFLIQDTLFYSSSYKPHLLVLFKASLTPRISIIGILTITFAKKCIGQTTASAKEKLPFL